MIQRLAANLPDVAYTHQNQEPSEPHIRLLFTYSAQDFKSYQTLRKSIAQPTLGPTMISTTFRFVCVLFILIK